VLTGSDKNIAEINREVEMAEKKAAKAAGPDAIMAPAEMKPILALSKRGTPISCAIALTKEKEGVILLHKKLKPKKLLAELKKEAADAGLALDTTSLRFGRAEVDVDVDPGLLTLIVNKDAPGVMRPKLLEQVRKAGYKSVEITIDTGLESESEEEDQSAAGQDAAGLTGPGQQPTAALPPAPPPTQSAAPPPGGKQAPADAAALTKELTTLVREMVNFIDHNPAQRVTLVRLATEAQISLKQGDLQKVKTGIEVLRKALKQPASAAGGGTPAPSPQSPGLATATVPTSPPPPQPAGVPQTPAPGADAGALTARITSLVKQLIPLIASDPARLDAFKKTAAASQAALKAGDLAGAAKAADALQAMLGISPAAPAASAGNGTAPPDPAAGQKVAKSRLAWVATRKKIETDLGKLKNAVMVACQGIDIESALEVGFRERVEPVLEQLDESLAHKLDEVNGAADTAQRAKLVAEAKGIIKRYEAFAAGSQIIAKLDANPFFPLAISKTLAATLGTLSSAIG
jgi:hypothetical protein